MNVLSNVGRTLLGKTGKVGQVVQKNGPTAMVVVGCVGVGVGVVMACKATLKCDDILAEMEGDIERVNKVRENVSEDRYSESDYKKDMTIVYAKGGVKLAKLYGPSIMVIALSMASILGGHNILRKRHIALTAAYGVVSKSFDEYRERVRLSEGENKDRQYLYGLTEEVIGVEEYIDENGKKHKEKIKGYANVDTLSMYSRYFDNTCEGWTEDLYYNECYLIDKQREANRMLAKYRSLTLNDVYDLLDIPRTDYGYVVGWIYDKDYKKEEHNFEDQVDFRIFNPRNSAAVNGVEPVYILDFNVGGTIYGKCPNKFAV